MYGLSAGISETVKNVIEPYTPQYLKASYAFQPVATGISAMGVNYIISYLLGGGLSLTKEKLLYPFLLGTGADILSGYITDNVVKPMVKVKNTVESVSSLNPVEIIEEGFENIGGFFGLY